ncbi:cell surface protein [Methanosarcina siciliae T4/M]|uniref:Probable pectate lyase C n=1 Tax=Methanosarcina siciliae T4/M TaxID=1434120 RepID=A0A0E3P8F5_9EURY|nr:PQQ-binding-like beta-propeller repeat protein [Methanosarcina siciliae]AKB30295.1 cell surface protein [Methanosarcina siciliae T4/M]
MNKHTLKIFLICLLLLLVAAAQPVLGSDWAQFQKDVHNTGVTADRAPITDPTNCSLSWNYSMGGNIDVTPVVAGDMTYVVASNNHLCAFNRTTGTLLWEESTSGGGFLLGNLAVGNGIVFVPTVDGKIFAFDAETGSPKWNKTLSSKQLDTPILYYDGKIYFGEAMGGRKYYCLDETGNEVWNRTSTTQISGQGSYYWAGAAVIGDGLVYGDDDGHLVSVNKDTGTDIAEINVSEEFGITCKEIRSSVLYVEELNRIYFTSKGGYCYALGFNGADGTFNTSDKYIANIGYSTSTPAYYNGRVYVGAGGMYGGGSGISCLDADLTDEIWHYAAGAVQSSPAISTYYDDGDGEAYIYFTVNSATGGVFCLKDYTGCTNPELTWSYADASKTAYTLAGAVISDGWIYYGTDKRYLFGFTTEEEQKPSIPVANFSANPLSGDAPLTVNFTDLSTGDGITTWAWDFDYDGNADSNEQNPSHSFNSTGTYTVSLTVTGDGGSDTETKTNYITASETVTESGWSQFQKDSSHTGYTFSSVPTRDPELLWQKLTSSEQEPCGSGGINVPSVISGNTVFVTAGNASVWAFNKDTGDLIWSKELGGDLTQTSTPALGNGKLFVPTAEGDIYAFDPENGSELWKAHVTNGNLECPITYSDHKLYIGDGLEGGTGTKYYYCYDDSGNLVWQHENTNTSGFIWSGSVVVGDYLIYPVFEGKMVCLEKDTGTFVDEVDFSKSSDVSFALTDPGMFRSSVTYADGALYTSSERGQETGYCFKVGFNPETGQFLDSGWAASIGFSTSTPVVYDGRVYVGHGEHGETGSMFCLNDSDGTVIWETPVSGGIKSSPVISVENGDPYIYFTEAIVDGSIYCLNPDGTLAWHYNPPEDSAYTLQGAALSNDKVYYGTDNGYLYCIGQGEALPPTANFSSDKQTGAFPLTVSFKDGSFNANKFLWDFGDGNTSTEVNPVHTYTAAGSYTVTLTVENNHGEDTKVVEDYIYAVKVPTTWPVKSGESIQVAIDSADSGDIIKVYPGEYHEVLNVNKTLTLKGIRDPILNASGFTGSSGITVSAEDVEISGFEITGTEEMCFAINVNAKNALIEDNLIDDCAEGVWLQGTENTLRQNNISNCWDFAAVLDSAGDNRIYQNTFIDNNGRKMGGSSDHISGGAGSFFQSPEPVEYLWEGEKLTGYMGNYYDDYTGNDSDGDGIGDVSYTADSGTDQYPLVMPYSNYVEEQENESVPENSWYQFHGKVDHLGYSESGPGTNRTEWVSEDIDAISSSSPVVAGGKVFVICGAGGMEESTDDIPQLVALDEFNGDISWNVSIPKAVYGSWASPAYDDGMVFTATGPELGCYDAETGEKIWCFNDTVGSQGAVNSGPAIADGMVIFSDWDGSHYYCLDEYTGYLLWSFEVVGDGQSVPAYADGKFYLTSWGYGSSYAGHAYCVDAVTGDQVWHINNIEQNFCGSPAYKDGVLYLTTYNFYGDGDLLALDAADGSIIWQQTIERTDSTPAFAYGNVYVCGGCSGFSNVQTYCFNASTGEKIWETPSLTGEDGGIGGWTCSVAVADGLAYVGTEGNGYFGYNDLYALDAFTGEVVWHAPHAGSTPAISDGMLFSIGADQKVYAFKDSLSSPVANFSADVTSGVGPLEVQFTDSSTGSPTSWEWDFNNDGNVDSTEQNPQFIYTGEGTYSVKLTVTNSEGSDSELKIDYISVVYPSPDFTANVTEGTVPLTVEFTGNVSGLAPDYWNMWAWDVDGDGTYDYSPNFNITHTYTEPGTYDVIAAYDGWTPNVKAGYITVLPEIPVANFSADVKSGLEPLTVNFTDQSTGTISSWLWDFGDGANSTEQNPVHTYSAAGNYTVNLTVENAAGSDFELKSDYIEVSEDSGATVTLYFDPESSSVSESESTEISIVASNFPAGFSGYNLTVALDDPAVAEIVDIEYPSWALITENSSLPGTSIYLKAVDGEDAVKEGAADVVLATLTVSGKEKGSANLSIEVDRLDDDSGDSVEPAFLAGTIEVTLLSPLPDQEYAPKDLDGDGLYEDLTGNGEFSFVDIVAYFHNMDWIEENMPVEYFDFNGNGRIDFDDVVDMFAMI